MTAWPKRSFEDWWEKSGQHYEAAVVANGNTPWPQDPDKREAIAKRLGLPTDTPDMDLRRALWNRRNSGSGSDGDVPSPSWARRNGIAK